MYSLAVSLYELLTGTRPFTADTMEDLMNRILRQDPAPPSSVNADLPKDIDRIILQALGKKPEHRYPTWAEFALDLSKVVRLVLPPEAISDSEKYVALKRVGMLTSLADSELWELARAGAWKRVPRAQPIVKENDTGQSFFFLAQGQVKVIRQGRLLNTIDQGECFGEMAYIRGGELPRHATVESLTDIVLAEFEPAALAQMSVGAQLALTRALVRNVVDRLELANSRVAR
jgi:hypothetical protein